MNNSVRFALPDDGSWVSLDFQQSYIPSISGNNLNHFLNNYYIFYRIYISGRIVSSPSESTYQDINPTLYSDYNALKSYTVTTNNNASSVGSAFSSRNFFRMNDRSGPQILRSRELITPYPSDNRYFFYSADLVNPAYLNSNNNADVVANSSSSGGSAYAYTAMYVTHKAFNTTTLAEVYSSPTFLGVFLLPNNTGYITVDFETLSIHSEADLYNASITITLSNALNTPLELSNITVEDITDSQGEPIPITLLSVSSNDNKVYSVKVSGLNQINGRLLKVSLSRSGYNFNPSSLNATVLP
jgi:hypothetical protein